MALIFSYGDYSFNPKPLFTIGKEYIKTPSQMGLGTRYTLTLEGQIIPASGTIPGGDAKAGLTQVFSGVDELSRAFDNDFKLLELYCDDGSPHIISGYPRITEFSVNNASDNYVVRADYSITLDLPSLTGAGFDPVGPAASGAGGCGVDDMDLSGSGIINYSDDFTVEFLDERVMDTPFVLNTDTAHGGHSMVLSGGGPSIFSIQRTITAQGDSLASADAAGACHPYTQPWQRAREFVENQLGINNGYPVEIEALSGLMCPPSNGPSPYEVVNNFRNISVNKTDGTVTANQTFLALTGGGIPAYEDFQVSTAQNLADPFITITIDGTVNGLSKIDYSGCPATGEPKFNNAIAYWANNISGTIYGRSQAVLDVVLKDTFSGHVNNAYVNYMPLSKTIGYNPIAGTVTYSYTYDNRPQNCYHHAITEEITFTENEPQDVFASLTILGRAAGPLFQTIGTIGARTRELSVNAVLPMVTNCSITGVDGKGGFYGAPDVYDQLVLDYAAILAWNYPQVFVTASSKTWEPKTGRFSLNQSWTVGTC